MKRICACVLSVMLFMACNKKAEERAAVTAETAMKMAPPKCVKEIIIEKPVKVGETGIVLPVGTKLCFSSDELEIRVELPFGYNFWANKTLPIFATYSCNCSASGTACKVFYMEGQGFGCLQSSCSGSCTGKFSYLGYTVDRLISGKSDFFSMPEVQKEIAKIKAAGAYSRHEVFGVSFFLVNDEVEFAAAASCNCEGTQACKLKKIKIPFVPVIYFCEGSCNGCELTV